MMMRMRFAIASTLLLALLATAAPAGAKCAPRKVLKIVTSIDDPAISGEHFARRPKTLYRLGEKYGRLEEEKNGETGLHLLIVISEPDVWMVNRADNSGQHSVDPGPTFIFRAPLVSDISSKYWNNLEMGCEVPFMNAVGAKPEPVDGHPDQHVYVHSAEGTTVRLIVGKNDIPLRAEIASSEGKFAIVYHSFEQLDTEDASLFAKPAGVKFTEQEQE